MKYLSGLGLLIAVVVSLSATVAVAQTPVATPTAPATASSTPNGQPFNGTVPVIVDVTGQLPPGAAQPIRMTVTWAGVGDLSASYEVERSATDSTATRDFQRLATVPSSTPANGQFSYTEADRSLALEVCYRVRAVSGSLASAYSAERCLPIPPRSGPGIGQAPSAPATGSGVTRPADDALPLQLGVALLSLAVALVVVAKGRRSRHWGER